jgi:hypothetical protein
MSIVVKSYQNDEVTFGVPPYYFRAFPIGGIPTLALAGSDRNALSWRVDQAVGKSQSSPCPDRAFIIAGRRVAVNAEHARLQRKLRWNGAHPL